MYISGENDTVWAGMSAPHRGPDVPDSFQFCTSGPDSCYLTPPECACAWGCGARTIYTRFFIAHRPPAGGNLSPSLQYIAISSSQ